jgi:hypothetical protein
LLIGKVGRSAIVTLVERATRSVMLGRLPEGGDRDAASVAAVISELAVRLPERLRRSLAWDQGAEMAEHAAFTVATGCPVDFCDPHSPWQRGANVNTNGLLRQYFPKGSFDFTAITEAELDAVAHELNTRPRQTSAGTPRHAGSTWPWPHKASGTGAQPAAAGERRRLAPPSSQTVSASPGGAELARQQGGGSQVPAFHINEYEGGQHVCRADRRVCCVGRVRS